MDYDKAPTDIAADIARIKDALLIVDAPPAETFGFVRPAVRDVSPWLDKTTPTATRKDGR